MTAESPSAAAANAEAGREAFTFQAEVGRLLHIVANALYSEREVFLRELISNASDACDKLRYAALTDPALQAADTGLEVRIGTDKTARTMTVADTGIGMTRQELIDNLGTIARSGTTAFLETLAKAKADAAAGAAAPSLIGQFGVGFYAAFMVADRVAVTSRRAGTSEAWTWESDGKGSFTIEPAAVDGAFRGTRIVLHMKADAEEFLDDLRIKGIVRRYSDHVALPVRLGDGAEAETINSASALWTRPRAEVSESDHENFFRHVGGGFGKPWLTLHFRAEGTFEYTGLLYVPEQKPFDLLDPSRKSRVRLYVRRVFITDDVEGLVPPYLRFLKGVVDTADLPLNISREMLQRNPLVDKMRAGIVKRTVDALKKRADEDAKGYEAFWESFGPVLKEGLYEDFAQRDALLELARFRSTAGDGWVDLATYVRRMKEGQDAIYTIAGPDAAALRKSPQIEAFLAKGIEVLLLTDPIDEFWVQSIGTFKDKPFKSATRGGVDLSKMADAGTGAKDGAGKSEA
ncbi:MAG: molecular chaperone HtpG, partial [Alphaproteobacteria bacterium]|nr:molecular chaperone HtpG [Alphaproteobacteria bacterium]